MANAVYGSTTRYQGCMPEMEQIIDMAPNITHDKCLPRLAISAITAVMAKVAPMISRVFSRDARPKERSARSAAKPNQATDVICQAKRRVCLVKLSPPKSLGRGCRKSLVKIYFSPSHECARPTKMAREAATRSIAEVTPEPRSLKSAIRPDPGIVRSGRQINPSAPAHRSRPGSAVWNARHSGPRRLYQGDNALAT